LRTTVALGLAVGWVFGRLGCTTAHDHPGRHTGFLLAVRYPDGPRFDLGLYEFVFTLILTIVLFRYARHPRPAGRLPRGAGVVVSGRIVLDPPDGRLLRLGHSPRGHRR